MSQVMGFNGQMPSQSFPVDNIFTEKGDDQRVAIFYVKPVPDAEKSLEAGYTVSVDQVYCRHHEVGDKLTVHDEPATPTLQRRYARQWALFGQGRGGEHVGMDLNLLFPGQPSLVMNLQAHGIFTVEELSGLSDHGKNSIGMGADLWQRKAVDFLAKAKDTAAITRMDAELAKRDEEISALREQMKAMIVAQNRAPSDDEPAAPRRGRPPKARAFDPDEEDNT